MAQSKKTFRERIKGRRESTNVEDRRGLKLPMPKEWRTPDEIAEDDVDDMLFEARATRLWELRQRAKAGDAEAAKKADWEEKDIYREANAKYKNKMLKRLRRQANGRLD